MDGFQSVAFWSESRWYSRKIFFENVVFEKKETTATTTHRKIGVALNEKNITLLVTIHLRPGAGGLLIKFM